MSSPLHVLSDWQVLVHGNGWEQLVPSDNIQLCVYVATAPCSVRGGNWIVADYSIDVA